MIAPYDFPGIYIIQSKIKPERVYVGSAVSLEGRKKSHLSCLRGNTHRNSRLQNHFNKYGQDDFVFSVIKCVPTSCLIEAEQFFIDEMNPFFNISKIAGRTAPGRVVSEATRKKISQSKKGKPLSPLQLEVLKKLNSRGVNPFKGRRHTPESIEKMRQAKIGKKPSPETRQKLRDARLGAKNHFYGKKHSQATKKSMSEVWHATHRDLPQFKKGTPVLQYSLDGRFIREWDTVVAAAKSIGITKRVMHLRLRSENNIAGGYRWQRKDGKYRKSKPKL